jgi:4-hydroxy-2-oxoheptanedioate aldolase
VQQNRAKRILREGGLALGAQVGGIASPMIIEIIGHAGYDAAFIDMEHTAHDLRDVQVMVMAAERVGITPIVRTPGFDPAFILRLLDMGVQGIQVPHISNAAAAREAVKAVRYAPLGDRGMAGTSRAADYGRISLRDHLEQSNREIILTVMIEDLPALEDIDAIAATEGIDLISVGPSDMSRAVGAAGESSDPRLIAAIEKVSQAVKRGGVAKMAFPMNHSSYPRNAAQLLELGVGYANCAPTPEVRMMRSMIAQVEEAHKLLG